MQVSLDFVCRSINGRIIEGNDSHIITGVTTDSRKVEAGMLFIALLGEKCDGHDFVRAALAKGARAAVVSRVTDATFWSGEDKTLILVDDTLQALQALAASYRRCFDIPVIAVTGSVGKTTIKDLVALYLSSTWKTLKTQGNYNNDIGLPLTLLQLDESYQVAVVEMGMGALGEIQRLAAIARPQFALISNVEPVHLETLGSLENIARAKCEVLSEISEDGFALINGDNKLLIETAREYSCRKYTFGCNGDCDFQAANCTVSNAGMKIDIRWHNQLETLFFPLPARRLALNIVAAAALAHLLGIEMDSIKDSLLDYKPSGNRLNIISLENGGAVINDTYNANQLSMAAALETSRELAGSGKYAAVLGDMFELGSLETEAHLNVGQIAYTSGVDLLITVGKLAQNIAQGALEAGMNPMQVHHFPTKAEALEYLQTRVDNQWTLLFKASRGMELETLVDELFARGCLVRK
ncbi:MAG: UDP-N-acetylmuramoyl-tripeptide--D-alanyl-D-alanine ligase [Syntrophomonadaceae bacterium]|nr:UDP-N-acetylmuramoyl-tripeptide--D-alanyl-D-alanine ligase [Syntrophomonadaceae bacterium]MDD3897726.1 UDP-N-acetylmuramoyl-tripeptide--D-alanyl-D-alanine ligase [Syntrophomonadaceae bacterium]